MTSKGYGKLLGALGAGLLASLPTVPEPYQWWLGTVATCLVYVGGAMGQSAPCDKAAMRGLGLG